MILCFSPWAHPHVVASVLLEHIGRQNQFEAGSAGPRDRDALGVIHKDRKILSMIGPIAFVSDAILRFSGPENIDVFLREFER